MYISVIRTENCLCVFTSKIPGLKVGVCSSWDSGTFWEFPGKISQNHIIFIILVDIKKSKYYLSVRESSIKKFQQDSDTSF